MIAYNLQNLWKTGLAAVTILAFFLSACTSPSLGADARVGYNTESHIGHEHIKSVDIVPANQEVITGTGTYITVNVEVTDEGYNPSLLSLPAGRQVMLVMRNRGQSEHHLHIKELVPANMLWLSKEQSEVNPSQGLNIDEHAQHHQGGELVPYHICTSGVCPTEDTVHLHAVPGDMDIVLFTPTNRGTFEIVCPLHDNMKATVTVF